jgi:hypothetical protein
MGQGWFLSRGRSADRSNEAGVTVSELVDRYGVFYGENGQRLLTRRSLIRVARHIQRAKRKGTLIMPGDRRHPGPPRTTDGEAFAGTIPVPPG